MRAWDEEIDGTTVTDHLPLVTIAANVVAQRTPASVSRDDLAGAGTEGLLTAWGKYDPSLSQFTTYANRCINWAILDELRRWIPPATVLHDVPDLPAHDRRLEAIPDQLDLADAVAALPPQERGVIRRKLEGWKSREIAKADRLTESRISQVYHRALERLSNTFGGVTPRAYTP